MQVNTIAALVLLALVLCLSFGLAAPDAHAQGAVSGDKALASKESGTLATKEFDQDKLPGKLEYSLAGGSILALIAVMKWL